MSQILKMVIIKFYATHLSFYLRRSHLYYPWALNYFTLTINTLLWIMTINNEIKLNLLLPPSPFLLCSPWHIFSYVSLLHFFSTVIPYNIIIATLCYVLFIICFLCILFLFLVLWTTSDTHFKLLLSFIFLRTYKCPVQELLLIYFNMWFQCENLVINHLKKIPSADILPALCGIISSVKMAGYESCYISILFPGPISGGECIISNSCEGFGSLLIQLRCVI